MKKGKYSKDRTEVAQGFLSKIGKGILFFLKWYFIVGITLAVTILFGIVGFFLGFFGIRISPPNIPNFKPQTFDNRKFRQEFENSKLQDILQKFNKQFKELEALPQLSIEQRVVVRKLRQFDRSKYDRKMKEIFSKQETDELIRLLLMLLGAEVV